VCCSVGNNRRCKRWNRGFLIVRGGEGKGGGCCAGGWGRRNHDEVRGGRAVGDF